MYEDAFYMQMTREEHVRHLFRSTQPPVPITNIAEAAYLQIPEKPFLKTKRDISDDDTYPQ